MSYEFLVICLIVNGYFGSFLPILAKIWKS